MKTFDDLEFNPHPSVLDTMGYGILARLDFDNGYGVSVILGDMFYSNGKNTYEVAVFKDGSLCFDTDIRDDVIGYLSPDHVTEIMRLVQEL